MTITLRNSILRVCLAVVVITGVAAAAAVLPHAGNLPGSEQLRLQQAHRWLLFRWNAAPDPIAWITVALFSLSGFSAVGAFSIIRYFRKTTAPEMLFFAMFVLSLGLEVWKLGHIVFVFESLPAHLAVNITRIVHFGRLFGMLCLFVSTLYLTGIDYQQTGVALNMAALITLTIVYVMPVDHLVLHPNLVHKIGDESMMQMVMLVLQLLSIANVTYAVAYQKRDEYALLLFAVVVAIIGRELIFYLPSLWATLAGLVLLCVASGVFGTRLHNIYLWK
jgi:hypothetical protein